MAELKPVKVHWEAIDRYAVFVVTRFEVMYEDQLVGYYRIFMEPNSVNIAFYSDTDRHGVLPPETYKVIPTNHKMIRMIEDDLNKMGYTIPDGHTKISDGMLVGMERFPMDWEVLY
jgi:hypothetical protein